MIDLLFHAKSKQHIEEAAKGFDLYIPVTEERLVTPATEEAEAVYETITTGWRWRTGITISWWAGSGKMLKAHGTYDEEGTELTAPVYVDGVVGLFRLHGDFEKGDRLGAESEGPQYLRSKVAAYLTAEGEAGDVEGIACNTLMGVGILNPTSLNKKIREWGVPGHEFSGGVNH